MTRETAQFLIDLCLAQNVSAGHPQAMGLMAALQTAVLELREELEREPVADATD